MAMVRTIDEYAVSFCRLCVRALEKAIDARVALCENCNRFGCDHLVANDRGLAICCPGEGCNKPEPKRKPAPRRGTK